MSTTPSNFYAALVNAQKSFEAAAKTSNNPHFRSKYAALDACVDAVKDALNDNGIFLHQRTHLSDDGVTVETVFIHESGEQLSGGLLHVPASKQDAQGYGSALTYARRYSLLAACGIAPEDDDGNAASKPRPTPSAEEIKTKLTQCQEQVTKTAQIKDLKNVVGPFREWAKLYGLGDMNKQIVEMAQVRANELQPKEE